MLRLSMRNGRANRLRGQISKHALTVMAAVFVLLIVGFPSGSAQAATAPLRPPSSINNTCGSDVSGAMTAWLTSLPSGTSVDASRDCFLVNEGMSMTLNDITISGGTWKDDTPPAASVPYEDINAVFWLVGGSNITVENLSIQGVNGAPYNEGVAFQGGIRSDGVQGLTISGVSVRGLGGDGITLTGSDRSPYMPTANAVVTNVTITDVGRQGITLSDIDGAKLSNLALTNIGLDTFDMEADNYGEVAQNVVVNGCTANGAGGDFFGNGGQAGGNPDTSDIVVENCTMEQAQTGTAIFVDTPAGYGIRGPFTFANDWFDCGSSAYVGCVEVTGGTVRIVNSTLTFPTNAEPQYRRVWDAFADSSVDFTSDVVAGYSTTAEDGGDGTGVSAITGGSWTPWSEGLQSPSPPAETPEISPTTVPAPETPEISPSTVPSVQAPGISRLAVPPPETPEIPIPVLLPASVLVIGAVYFAVQTRRRRRRVSASTLRASVDERATD
jgi:Right handed beta helix region